MRINKNELALILSPIENKNNEWTGEIDIKIRYDTENTYSKAELDSFINLMTLMCTSVDLMENDSNFLSMLHDHRDYLNENKGSVEDQLELLDTLETKVSTSPKIVEKIGNVIKLNWGTQ